MTADVRAPGRPTSGRSGWSATARPSGRGSGATPAAPTSRSPPTGRAQAGGARPPARAASRSRLVLASPLSRATDTARLAGFGDVALVDDPDLTEWDYGALEGRADRPTSATDYPGWTIWRGPWPGGETPDEVGRPRRPGHRPLPGPDVAGDALLFAHGHLLRVLAARWLGLPAASGGAVRARDRDGLDPRLGPRPAGHRDLERGLPRLTVEAQATPTERVAADRVRRPVGARAFAWRAERRSPGPSPAGSSWPGPGTSGTATARSVRGGRGGRGVRSRRDDDGAGVVRRQEIGLEHRAGEGVALAEGAAELRASARPARGSRCPRRRSRCRASGSSRRSRRPAPTTSTSASVSCTNSLAILRASTGNWRRWLSEK